MVKIHKDIKMKRISSNYQKKIDGYVNVLKNNDKNVYNLNVEDKKILEKKLYLELGFFKILSNESVDGRHNILQGIQIETKYIKQLKYKIFYYLSFSPLILKMVIYLSKRMWSTGLIKT